MPGPLEFWDLLGRLALALFAGLLLGWERESHNKPAGVKTHMLVGLGSAIFMAISFQFAASASVAAVLRPDPMRVLQGIVGGAGFLGAGSIIQSRGAVHGITTASTIWLAAAIGAACGMGYYAIALASVILGLTTLILFRLVENFLFPRPKSDVRDQNEIS